MIDYSPNNQDIIEFFCEHLNSIIAVTDRIKLHIYELVNVDIKALSSTTKPNFTSILINSKKVFKDLRRIESVVQGYLLAQKATQEEKQIETQKQFKTRKIYQKSTPQLINKEEQIENMSLCCSNEAQDIGGKKSLPQTKSMSLKEFREVIKGIEQKYLNRGFDGNEFENHDPEVIKKIEQIRKIGYIQKSSNRMIIIRKTNSQCVNLVREIVKSINKKQKRKKQ